MNDPRLLWWIDRSAGLVSMVLLTLVMVLGVLALGRPGASASRRALVQGLHRQLPLVAGVLLAVHVGTAVADSFVPLGPADVLVPFVAGYRPLWIGLGTLALDLLVVVVVTSLLRARLGHRGWRLVHWTAYALWPLAVVHALGSGSDMHAQTVHRLGFVCVAAVVGAAGWRLVSGGGTPAVRMAGLVVLLLVVALTTSWAARGPLAAGWSKKALSPADGAALTTSVRVERNTLN
jgi:sulfoxide reductase heme-binding subunit YedZ